MPMQPSEVMPARDLERLVLEWQAGRLPPHSEQEFERQVSNMIWRQLHRSGLWGIRRGEAAQAIWAVVLKKLPQFDPARAGATTFLWWVIRSSIGTLKYNLQRRQTLDAVAAEEFTPAEFPLEVDDDASRN